MKEKRDKPRIALLGVSTLGGGPLGQGIPSIAALFDHLSQYYSITFYSFGLTNVSRISDFIRVKQVSRWRLPGRLKYLLLSFKIVLDHLRNNYSLLFAVSAYPAGLYAVRLGKLLKRPVAVQYIALEAVAITDIVYGNLTIPWLRKITTWVSEQSTSLIMVSEWQKVLAMESLPSVRKMDVLPLRINPKNFSYRKKEISFPVELIHIAYYSPIKGQDILFEAFSKVSKEMDCHLTVIGDGFNVREVKKLLEELEITDKVSFLGLIPQSELPTYFERAQILVHPARFETGCAVIQEAMASGVAVCGTDVGLLNDIGDQFAVIVPVGNPEKLAEGILQLVRSPKIYERITMEAYLWITKYDAAWANENYIRFIESLLQDDSAD